MGGVPPIPECKQGGTASKQNSLEFILKSYKSIIDMSDGYSENFRKLSQWSLLSNSFLHFRKDILRNYHTARANFGGEKTHSINVPHKESTFYVSDTSLMLILLLNENAFTWILLIETIVNVLSQEIALLTLLPFIIVIYFCSEESSLISKVIQQMYHYAR